MLCQVAPKIYRTVKRSSVSIVNEPCVLPELAKIICPVFAKSNVRQKILCAVPTLLLHPQVSPRECPLKGYVGKSVGISQVQS